MESVSLYFYNINDKYMRYISKYDNKIMCSIEAKANRPYIGILLNVNNLNYFAPMTSPKHKHLNMKNTIDFLKIKNGNYGAINFNNMIPIPSNECNFIDFKSITDNGRKQLFINQYKWCKTNNQIIYNKANKLYSYFINNRLPHNIKARCCNFPLLEKKCLEYELLNSHTEIASTIENNTKSKYPSKYISNETANKIQQLNQIHNTTLSVDQIKQLYKDAGKKYELSMSQDDFREFKELKSVVDELNHAQHSYKQDMSKIDQVKLKSLDLDL